MPQLSIGSKFWEIYKGQTLTGFGQVSKIWEITAELGNGNYSCKQLSNNAVPMINPDYREKFTESDIQRILIKTPLL